MKTKLENLFITPIHIPSVKKTVTINKAQAIRLNLTSTRPGVAMVSPRGESYNPRGAGSYSLKAQHNTSC